MPFILERVGDYQDGSVIINGRTVFIRIFDDIDRRTEITIPEVGYSVCISTKSISAIEKYINQSISINAESNS